MTKGGNKAESLHLAPRSNFAAAIEIFSCFLILKHR